LLVTLLRPALVPKEITLEPEGHMAADKRADVSVAMPGRKILCELKRDYHVDLWTAANQQLERFYAHDPEAKGFGIYGVFWFGGQRARRIPKHPDLANTPESAAELERMLRDLIPACRRARLAVLVIDVSGPGEVRRRRRRSAATKKPRSAVRQKATKRKSIADASKKVATTNKKKIARKRSAGKKFTGGARRNASEKRPAKGKKAKPAPARPRRS
jgi:hypothetical protein